MSSCPCGSGADFETCCGPLLGGAPAPNPEALMRSRYTAFVKGDIDYMERSQAPDDEEPFDRAGIEEMARSVTWTGLEILATSGGGEADATGTVEFAAHYKRNGTAQIHHERGNFRRADGRWLYVDGVISPKGPPRQVVKVGRNDPCPCGSGKKYKKCCGQ